MKTALRLKLLISFLPTVVIASSNYYNFDNPVGKIRNYSKFDVVSKNVQVAKTLFRSAVSSNAAFSKELPVLW